MSSTGKKVFGIGTLTIGSETVGVLQDVSLDINQELVPLYGSQKFAEAVAIGKVTVKGSAKAGEFNPTLVTTLSQGAMALDAGVSLTWVVTGTDAKTITFTSTSTHITSYKLSGGGDKWFATDIQFECIGLTVTVQS